jgi:hypothetical protein
MRLLIPATILALAACEPAKPAEEATAPREEITPGDPASSFMPPPVDPPRTYEAYSKTAMSFTPGVLTLTQTPQKSENTAPGAVFAFGNGIIYETTSIPGGATQGATPPDWSKIFVDTSGAPIDASQVQMHSVDKETVPPGTPNGGFCAKTSFLATYTVRSPGAEDLTIAAFQGDQWPPKDETALCGTFTYGSVH